MARMEQIRWSDGAKRIQESRESWREFVDALYEANPDVLPPKEYVTSIGIDVDPGQAPLFHFTLAGLKLPTMVLSTEDPLQAIGENGVE